jgi:hypothetical protein
MQYSLAVAILAVAVSVVPQPAAAQSAANVRVSARIVVIEDETFTRAGLVYAVLGHDRVQVNANGPRRGKGVRVQVGTHGVKAFLEAVRNSNWLHTESTQQILTMSGAEALISSNDLSFNRRVAHSRGPSLLVTPTVMADGRVHLKVSARLEDRVDYAWGNSADGSPALVETEVIARDGEEVILATSSAVQSTREAGILRWGAGQQGREMLVVVTAQVQ